MKALVLFLCLVLVDFIWARENLRDPSSNCKVRNPLVGHLWEFAQYNLPPALFWYQHIDNASNTEPWNFILSFCNRVDTVSGQNIETQTDRTQWVGWSHGVLESFENINSTYFIQRYNYGDDGYPCLTGRKAKVHVNCNGCPSGLQCFAGFNTSFCICDANYDRMADPCIVNIWASVACPIPYTPSPPPNPPPPNPDPGLSGGAIFGIILLLLVVFLIIGCVAGFIYNNKVGGKGGLDAVPGIGVFRKITDKQTGSDRFSSGTYERTAEEAQAQKYGTLL